MKAIVLIRLKDEVTDAPGRVVSQRLVEMGYTEVTAVRIGKVIELELESADREAEIARVERMCKELLANQAVEEFEILSVEE